jgi:FMN phosphatase YigB (HAD superfamily)
MGYEVALATNPIFPSIATRKRISWTGLDYNDFKLVTTYENSSFCKPNLKYYEEILSKLGYQANECLMVGNDVAEDMIASKLGMKVFLLPKCLINKNNEDINKYPHGDFNDLIRFIKSL